MPHPRASCPLVVSVAGCGGSESVFWEEPGPGRLPELSAPPRQEGSGAALRLRPPLGGLPVPRPAGERRPEAPLRPAWADTTTENQWAESSTHESTNPSEPAAPLLVSPLQTSHCGHPCTPCSRRHRSQQLNLGSSPRPPADERAKNTRYRHAVEYYSAMKIVGIASRLLYEKPKIKVKSK